MKTIISHPNFEYLVDEMVAKNPDTMVKGKIDWKVFPDGTPNLFIHDVKGVIEHKDVTYI